MFSEEQFELEARETPSLYQLGTDIDHEQYCSLMDAIEGEEETYTVSYWAD